MKTMLRMLPVSLLISGAALVLLALAVKSGATPVGVMDCGCGGGTECVTKNAALSSGLSISIAGGLMMVLGGIASGIQLLRRSRPACA